MFKKIESDADNEGRLLFDRANEEWEAGNLKEAFSLFNEAAHQGETYAFNSIGYFFDSGLGLTANFDKALFWYKKAARCGDALALSNIGLLYLRCGNERQAKYWLAKTVSNGDGDAMLELAKTFLRKKTDKNFAIGRRYLEAAIRSKSISADSSDEAKSLLSSLSGNTTY
jgi:hypothetical protein